MRQKEFGGLERARLIDRKLEMSFERYRRMGECSEVLEEALFVVEEELPEWLPGFIGNVEKNQAPAGAPSGVAGPVPTTQFAFCPHTNRGATNNLQSSQPAQTTTNKSRLGGYDGGVEVGFDGIWGTLLFDTMVEYLDSAKEKSSSESMNGGSGRNITVMLGGVEFMIMPYGTSGGVCYRYILKSGGIRLYIHSNPQQNIQPVRVHYDAESLIGRSFFDVHESVRSFLLSIGFTIVEEKISRLDMQIMCDIPVDDFVVPILSGQCVKRAQKDTIHRKHNKVQTYRLGVNTVMRIYDKRAELMETMDTTKLDLMLRECFDGELPTVLTRVEFQLRRDVLREMGINSVEDLSRMETSLVEWLTHDWFRILSEKKQAGHSHEQPTLSVWERVQKLFLEVFDGSGKTQEKLKLGSKRVIRTTVSALVKQAAGCLATAIAKGRGAVENLTVLFDEVVSLLDPMFVTILTRSTERSEAHQLSTGLVPLVEGVAGFPWEVGPDGMSNLAAQARHQMTKFHEQHDDGAYRPNRYDKLGAMKAAVREQERLAGLQEGYRKYHESD